MHYHLYFYSKFSQAEPAKSDTSAIELTSRTFPTTSHPHFVRINALKSIILTSGYFIGFKQL